MKMMHFGIKRCLFADARSYVQEAKELRFQEDFSAAIKIIRDGLSVFPDNASLHRAMGHELIRSGKESGFHRKKMDEAFKCFETAYILDPKSFECAFDYARCLRKAGKFDDAEGILISLFDELLLHTPNNLMVLDQLGRLYQDTGRDEWAACCYHACSLIDPEDVDIQFTLHKIEITLDLEPCEEDWEHFLEYAQDVVNAAYERGILLMFEESEPQERIITSRTRHADLDLDLVA